MTPETETAIQAAETAINVVDEAEIKTPNDSLERLIFVEDLVNKQTEALKALLAAFKTLAGEAAK